MGVRTVDVPKNCGTQGPHPWGAADKPETYAPSPPTTRVITLIAEFGRSTSNRMGTGMGPKKGRLNPECTEKKILYTLGWIGLAKLIADLYVIPRVKRLWSLYWLIYLDGWSGTLWLIHKESLGDTCKSRPAELISQLSVGWSYSLLCFDVHKYGT